ncbi:MAG: hypothetical protein QOI20_3260 [Acidimicrobiaceae bacterium]|jgi:hypothetical protein|nr:hypothetical protein [Acidimicrobiaceae bacterium]
MSTTAKPTVGRIVHYNRESGGEIIQEAAMIVAVLSDTDVTLAVFNGAGAVRAEPSVPHGEGKKAVAGTWSWPAHG